MNLRRYGGFAVLVLAGGLAGYWATYAWQQPATQVSAPTTGEAGSGSLTRWLGLSPEQSAKVAEIEAAFATERATLESQLETERARLAALFEDANATEDSIRQQVDVVMTAHDALERRIAEHLLALRPHLTADQRSRLFARFADGIREARGWRWRHGPPQFGDDRGGGPPADRGPGRGRGGGRGGGRGDSSHSQPATQGARR